MYLKTTAKCKSLNVEVVWYMSGSKWQIEERNIYFGYQLNIFECLNLFHLVILSFVVLHNHHNRQNILLFLIQNKIKRLVSANKHDVLILCFRDGNAVRNKTIFTLWPAKWRIRYEAFKSGSRSFYRLSKVKNSFSIWTSIILLF